MSEKLIGIKFDEKTYLKSLIGIMIPVFDIQKTKKR